MLKSIKRFAWFLFKSPQRQWVGWGTLLTDLKGSSSVLFRQFSGNKNPQTIWICTGNFNRSESLLQNLLPSLAKLPTRAHFGLSIADCGSTDIPDLENAIKKIWQGPLVFSRQQMLFSRATAFNKAIEQAPGDLVFVCDADMLLPENLEIQLRKFVTQNSAWFPVCQWQINENDPAWRWFTEGTGIFAATKDQLRKTGLYDEQFKEWGKEDWDLFFRFYKQGIMPLRMRSKGLYHTWHPSSKPADFKKMF